MLFLLKHSDVFILPINVKMPTNIYEHKFHYAQPSWAWKELYNLEVMST